VAAYENERMKTMCGMRGGGGLLYSPKPPPPQITYF